MAVLPFCHHMSLLSMPAMQSLQIEYNEKLASESEAHVKADKEHHDKTPEELQASLSA